MKNFTHLHVHNWNSLLDGFGSCESHVKRAKELGMTHLSQTNHNHLLGTIDFQNACNKEGITPILGLETYYTSNMKELNLEKKDRDLIAIERAEKDGLIIDKKMTKKDLNKVLEKYSCDTRQYHLILIAKNQIGWSNLVKIQSLASEQCTFNGRYLVDNKLLKAYSEGIICSTACMGSMSGKLINQGKLEEAEALIDEWHSIFKDDFYLEIQPLNIAEQHNINSVYMQWAKSKNIKVIATADVHYPNKEDYEDHDTLLCIGTGKMKAEKNRMKYDNEFWMKSYDEMIESFDIQISSMKNINKEEYKEMILNALENTNLIANQIEDIKLGSDVDVFPEFDVPNNLSPEEYITLECYRELYKYKNKCKEIDLKIYEKRIQDELKVINKKGYAIYFLVVRDYLLNGGCIVGPGRGSGAGSLVSFLLGITKIIDPIKHNLLFFRFLTMDRTSPPDIDSDLEYYGRKGVITYLENKYGLNKVCHIGNITALGVKNGLKDVGRVLGVPFAEANSLSKRIDEISDDPDLSFKKLDKLKESDDENEKVAWIKFNKLEEEFKEIFKVARILEGSPRQTGVHASGILISNNPINDLLPTRKAKDGTIVTLYTGEQLEKLKFIKFDLLGLRTLSVIDQTIKAIDKDMTFEDLYEMANLEDKDTYKLIQEKQVDGMFQIESNLSKAVISKVIPNNFEDIVAVTSLIRPGPCSIGLHESYGRRKAGEEEAVEPIRGTWEITKESYGTIIYQEQCMLIAKVICGLDDNQCDTYFRKALAKSDKKSMAMCRQWFIYGKTDNEVCINYDEENKEQPMYDPNNKYGQNIIGGINNGYTEKELSDFWKDLEGYSSYLFNKSHAACYSYITFLTAWLKKYHTSKFMASLLSVQTKDEKIKQYMQTCKDLNIKLKVPNINISNKFFTEANGDILYGIGSIKGVGEASIDSIIENRPYLGIEDITTRLPKKVFNKKVGTALIRSGAFDQFEENRHISYNTFFDIRKDKKEIRLLPEDYNKDTCIDMEIELLSAPITYSPWWDLAIKNKTMTIDIKINSLREHTDKNNNQMAFIKAISDKCDFDAIAFAKVFSKSKHLLKKEDVLLTVKGQKNDEDTFIISSIIGEASHNKIVKENFMNKAIEELF